MSIIPTGGYEGPMSDVQPFTWRDSWTFLEKLNDALSVADRVAREYAEFTTFIRAAIAAGEAEADRFMADMVKKYGEILGKLIGYNIVIDGDYYHSEMMDGTYFDAYTMVGVDKIKTSLTNSIEKIKSARPYVNVTEHGAVPNTDADSYAAFTKAIAATPPGGIVYVPPGRFKFARGLVIDKPISLEGGSPGHFSKTTQLLFNENITGIRIQESAGGVAPHGWAMANLDIVSANNGASGPGNGVYCTNGLGNLTDVWVEGFGQSGFLFQAGAKFGGGNVNRSTFTKCSSRKNAQDGFKLEGTDTQKCVLRDVDATNNGGYGINVDGANQNLIESPHIAQNYNPNARGAFRDNAISSEWRNVYCENGNNGAIAFFDDSSVGATLTFGQYGACVPTFATLTTKYRTNITNSADGRRSFTNLSDEGSQLIFDLGRSAIGVARFLTKNPAGESRTIFEASANNDVLKSFRHVNPNVSGSLNLGTIGAKWNDVRASNIVQIGVFTTANRPSISASGAGAMYFDSTLNRLCVCTGTNWIDTNGNIV